MRVTSFPSRLHTKQACSAARHATGLNCKLSRTAYGGTVFNCQRSRRLASSIYDNPVLYTNDDTFAEASYWDARYQKENFAPFEWYRGYASLRPVITKYLPANLPILQLGMGSSTIQYDMVTQDGYQKIVNVDYSPSVVAQQQQAHTGLPQLEYMVADARDLRSVAADSCFAGVLDKGTLDALLCGDNDEEDSRRLLQETIRVLQPGGVYLQITHAPPSSRLRYLQQPGLGWSGIEVWEVGQRGRQHGPYHVQPAADWGSDKQSSQQLPVAKEQYSHWVYACRKPA